MVILGAVKEKWSSKAGHGRKGGKERQKSLLIALPIRRDPLTLVTSFTLQVALVSFPKFYLSPIYVSLFQYMEAASVPILKYCSN
jgi:hypothetical protein